MAKKSLSIENYGFLSEPMPKRKKIIFSIHTSKKKIVEEVFPKVGCEANTKIVEEVSPKVGCAEKIAPT